MGKSIYAAVALTCLIFVLAIFIAPSVDMPETLVPLHHSTLRASGAQAGTVAGFNGETAFTVQQHAVRWWQNPRKAHHGDPVVRTTSTVLRC